MRSAFSAPSLPRASETRAPSAVFVASVAAVAAFVASSTFFFRAASAGLALSIFWAAASASAAVFSLVLASATRLCRRPFGPRPFFWALLALLDLLFGRFDMCLGGGDVLCGNGLGVPVRLSPGVRH